MENTTGKTVVQIVQDRMDAYRNWLLSGGVGPNPILHLGPAVVYSKGVK